MHYGKDFGIEGRIARFHNIYGPYGTWKGGREEAPAAFCRKALTSPGDVEMWGDGKQTRSFTFIDDGVDALLRIIESRGLPKSRNAAGQVASHTRQQTPFPEHDHPTAHRQHQQQQGQRPTERVTVQQKVVE